MTARERIEYLLDKDSDSIEIGALPGMKCMKSTVAVQAAVLWWLWGMYPEDNVSLLPMMLL